MKAPRFALTISLLILASLVSAPLAAKHHKEDGFVPLFDGKSLDGWHVVGGTGDFTVEDGMIKGFGTDVKGNTFLRSDSLFGDFDFRFSYKRIHGNSGMMFRAAQREGENGRVFGYQCEHGNRPERAWSGGIYDEQRRKWLQPHSTDPRAQAAFTKQGQRLTNFEEWNDVRILCEGNVIKIWFNGELRTHFIDTDPEHDTREGFFGMQVHSGKESLVYWKNLRIKEL